MKATVSTLYRNGRTLKMNTVDSTVVGDLNLGVSRHPVTGRCCCEATVLDSSGVNLIPELYDAVCICIAMHGIGLRGTEIVSGKEVAQQWWCIPMPN